MSTTLARTTQVLVDQWGVDPAQVTPESTLASLGLDSLDEVEFVMALEDEFRLEFADEDVVDLQTIQQYVDLVDRYLAAKAA